MDNRLKQDTLIEDALQAQTLAPMPRSITADVMARIQADKRPVFLTWLDFALSLVIAVCVGALFLTVQSLPPIILVKLRILSILLYQDFLVNMRWLVPGFFFGVAALLSTLTLPALFKMTSDRRQ
jgi:hypothetical protein